ncbi:hypothetical protein BKA69DRAFT_322484 [Paraphysoderma sedebokerense]|nr:hypothetical protein BKA69DRAFT_322484 [Paraphysoderma sedebokerense]
MDRIRDELADRVKQSHPPRNVTPYIKVRLCDYPERVAKKKPTTAMLTIWRPQESAMEFFREGTRLRVRQKLFIWLQKQFIHHNVLLAYQRKRLRPLEGICFRSCAIAYGSKYRMARTPCG